MRNKLQFVICLILVSSVSVLQVYGDNDKEKDKKPKKEKPGVPIDGGISLLLAAGVGLGAAKILHRKKESE